MLENRTRELDPRIWQMRNSACGGAGVEQPFGSGGETATTLSAYSADPPHEVVVPHVPVDVLQGDLRFAHPTKPDQRLTLQQCDQDAEGGEAERLMTPAHTEQLVRFGT